MYGLRVYYFPFLTLVLSWVGPSRRRPLRRQAALGGACSSWRIAHEAASQGSWAWGEPACGNHTLLERVVQRFGRSQCRSRFASYFPHGMPMLTWYVVTVGTSMGSMIGTLAAFEDSLTGRLAPSLRRCTRY